MKKLWCRLFGHKFESIGRAYCGKWGEVQSGKSQAYDLYRCRWCKRTEMVKIDE